MARNFKVYAKRSNVKPITAEIILKDPLVERDTPSLGRAEVQIVDESCIGTGPTSSRVAVVDYNAELDQVFAGAELHSNNSCFKTGQKSLNKNFHYHQVNVWAIIHKTLDLLEADDVLGRRIPWAFEGGRLKVLPHAGYDENAYYDRETGGLHFFYFESKLTTEPVFTCLSHDIVTHELGHAVLDGLKPFYNEVTSAATAGFHEYFGDAIALTASLNHKAVVVEVAGRKDSLTSTSNVIADIGRQFGAGLSEDYGAIADAYLRSAQNEKTMADLKGVFEEHDYSVVMTGAYYDLLESIYEQQMTHRDPTKGNERFAALYDSARVVRRMMLRALDYCPPVDINFFDYAQAVFLADKMAYPIDVKNYRKMWSRIAKKRGITKRLKDLEQTRTILNSHLRNLDIESLAASKTDAYDFIDANRAELGIPATANFDVINLYRTKKISADDYRVPQEVIIEFVWASEMKLTGKGLEDLRGTFTTLWCGGTLVFNRDGNLLHYTLKSNTLERRKQLKAYMRHLVDEGYMATSAAQGKTAKKKIAVSVHSGRTKLTRNASMRHFHNNSQKEHPHG